MKLIKKHFTKNSDQITCELCPNYCKLTNGKTGRCLARKIVHGHLYSTNYAQVSALSLDPIEKKPLYHFYPGKRILSVGSWGCNLYCPFCQNSELSQAEQPSAELFPKDLVAQAHRMKNNVGVAFTYNEPGIWYEYIIDCAPVLKQQNLMTVLVTNGYLCEEPWLNLCKATDAMNIDLKAFTEAFYLKCGGDLSTVKRNIKTAFEHGLHIELTHLVVTGRNDNESDFTKMVNWISQISESIPLHISRYFPNHKETAPATSPQIIEKFAEIASKKLQYVYCGNIAMQQDTYCPSCQKLLIKRNGYKTEKIFDGHSCSCGKVIHLAKEQ